jgi:hypothetical protein
MGILARRGAFFALTIAIVATACGCAAPSMPAGTLQIGQTLTSPASVGRYKLPLPPGEWTVTAENGRNYTDPEASRNTIWRGYYLVQVDPATKQFLAAVYLRGMLLSTVSTGWEDSISCDRSDVLFQDKLQTKFRSPECLLINHNTRFDQLQASDDSIRQAAMAWYRSAGLQLPNSVINVQLRLYSSTDGFILVNYWINPEARGQLSERDPHWATNNWHRSRLIYSPDRKIYVEKLREWALSIVSSYRAAMKHQSATPTLPAVP